MRDELLLDLFNLKADHPNVTGLRQALFKDHLLMLVPLKEHLD